MTEPTQSAANRVGQRRRAAPVPGGLQVLPAQAVTTAAVPPSDARPGGKLFAGGNFTEAGTTPVTNIAAWNGVDWSALVGPNGEGADSTVLALTLFDGKLIVGGSFLTAGGEVVSGIASWDGTQWQPLIGSTGGIGVSILPLGFVSALEVFDGDLYVGGLFQFAGGKFVLNVARWDGQDWFPLPGPSGDVGVTLGGNVAGSVFDMTQVAGELVVGGIFDAAGGVAANAVAIWNGSTWSSADQPIVGAGVLTVENFNDRIVAARAYSENNFGVNDVAWRDQGQWVVLGDRFDADVREFTNYNGQLIAVGQFTQVGSLTVNRVAAWNGRVWSALPGPSGTGTDGDVFAVAPHQGFLVVGGLFSEAGGVAVQNIARWNGSVWSALPGGGVNETDLLPTVFVLQST